MSDTSGARKEVSKGRKTGAPKEDVQVPSEECGWQQARLFFWVLVSDPRFERERPSPRHGRSRRFADAAAQGS